MKMDKANSIQVDTEKLGLKYIGAIPFDPQVEAVIGNPAKLLDTAVGRAMPQIKKSAKTKK
jgi:hypothetical protein